ncbi:MAG: isocitrate lyase/phosphoenolpyruvate mutase family protein [Rhodospirillaceae bacterium]|nr:isocitrate lyase/phosphoenolpyruvate mutase family protein [Rhodospirillaceae bacterium]
MPASVAAKRSVFRRLHEQGCFIIPNPWDIGSAKLLAHAGFKALASTSAGFAWAQGMPDGKAPLEDILQHLKDVRTAVEIPVTADFENGYADDIPTLEINVMRAAATGVAGLSIEDATGDPENPLYDFDQAVVRVVAARRALDQSPSGGEPALLTARSEGFIRGRPDLAETCRRLKAFAAAGADCLYAPGLKTAAEIEAVVKAVAPKPVNLLVPPSGLSFDQAAALGVRRLSVGGALARAAWGETQRVAAEMMAGSFAGLQRAATSAEVEKAL